MVKSSYQLFEFAVTLKFTSSLLSLIAESASYVLHVIARLDTVTKKNINSEWQWEERNDIFTKMNKALHSWIVKREVIGGSMFGGSVPQYGAVSSNWQQKGKQELKVLIHIHVLVLNAVFPPDPVEAEKGNFTRFRIPHPASLDLLHVHCMGDTFIVPCGMRGSASRILHPASLDLLHCTAHLLLLLLYLASFLRLWLA